MFGVGVGAGILSVANLRDRFRLVLLAIDHRALGGHLASFHMHTYDAVASSTTRAINSIDTSARTAKESAQPTGFPQTA